MVYSSKHEPQPTSDVGDRSFRGKMYASCTLRVCVRGGECPVTPGDEGPEMPNAQNSESCETECRVCPLLQRCADVMRPAISRSSKLMILARKKWTIRPTQTHIRHCAYRDVTIQSFGIQASRRVGTSRRRRQVMPTAFDTVAGGL